jgi:hypothetical protein
MNHTPKRGEVDVFAATAMIRGNDLACADLSFDYYPGHLGIGSLTFLTKTDERPAPKRQGVFLLMPV